MKVAHHLILLTVRIDLTIDCSLRDLNFVFRLLVGSWILSTKDPNTRMKHLSISSSFSVLFNRSQPTV